MVSGSLVRKEAIGIFATPMGGVSQSHFTTLLKPFDPREEHARDSSWVD
jgi:hypothetical protein